jgi:hypothetical protein
MKRAICYHAAGTYRAACARVSLAIQRHATSLLVVLGIILLTGGLAGLSTATGSGPLGSWSEAAFDDGLIRNSVGNLLKMLEGAFGALIMVIAGLMAIVAAAMGGYRTALGMLIVAVGAFILRSLVSLFFGTDYEDYTTG